MAIFTTVPRTRISWKAPPDVPRPVSEAHEFLIADGFFLNIGDGYRLTIAPQIGETTFTNTPRSKITTGGVPAVKTDYFLNIGDGFTLLIDDTNKLVTNPANPPTPWTTLNKT